MDSMTSTTSLRAFTDSHRIETKGGEWNVTAMGGGWIGKFDIPAASYEQFLELTHDYIFTKRGACSLLEQHLKVEGKVQGPILIDLDFKFPSGGPLTRRFTKDQLQRFVNAYVTAFFKFFKEPKEIGPLQFFVMLKPAPEDDKAHGCHKDGVHIVCPNITTYPEIQFALRGYLLQSGIMESIFGSTGFTNAPQDCFDIRVIATNNWFLYGACKPDKAWYKVETLYEATDCSIEEIDYSELTPLELTKMFSIRYGHNKVTDIVLKEGVDVEWLGLVQRWGAGSNFAKATKSPSLKGGAGGPEPPALDLSNDALIQVSGMSVRSDHSEEDIAIAYRLIRECLIPERRVKDYHDWVKMGMLLHNIAPTEESLKAWMEFSRRVKGSEGTSDSVYTEKWKLLPAESSAINRGRKPLMMGSLHHWAKEDAAGHYRIIMSDSNRDSAYLNDSGSHVSMAEQVIRMYRHEFRCTPLKKGAAASAMDWFQFTGHTWRNLKTCMRLRERLSNEVRQTFIQANGKVGDLLGKATNEDDRQRLEAKRKALFKIEGQLHNSGFKDAVMKESVEKFYDEEFLQNMNMDATTVGFSNGVLELRHAGSDGRPHVHFRPGMPDDCISFQMGRGMVGSEAIPYIPYDPTAAMQPPEYAEIMDFFTKIYPDSVLREYVLTLLSACLEGANREQKFYIMTGGGSNGKSKIVELMSSTFGEYQETLGTTAITRKRPESGAANPDLVVLKCKRFVSMVEPDEGEKINTASMKQLSGEDVVKARALFQDQDAFVIMARIFMCCNDMPPVSSMDNGTWRRLRVIPHVAKFVDHGQAVDASKHIHYKDLMLDAKIRRWRPYFASLLVWYYENHYLVHGLKEPAAVVAASNKYKEENDAFAAFCQDCIVKETGAETKAKDILARHREWAKFNPTKKVMRKEDILTRLTEVYGKPVDAAGKTYAGFRMAYDDEDISGNVISNI
jgi:P4 family phage/plasmid primase-like protien